MNGVSQKVARDPPHPPIAPSDEQVVERVLAGDIASFELLMRRYNQRLFRIIRSIVLDADEAEDVLQEAYVRAFEHLAQFARRSSFATWLTKIAIHEATARRRKRQRVQMFDPADVESLTMSQQRSTNDGEKEASSRELGAVLAQAVDALPMDLRSVFTLRMVEGLGTSETANCLDLSPANVKVRLHRARALLRASIDERIGVEARSLHLFNGERCDRVVRRVLETLARRGESRQ